MDVARIVKAAECCMIAIVYFCYIIVVCVTPVCVDFRVDSDLMFFFIGP